MKNAFSILSSLLLILISLHLSIGNSFASTDPVGVVVAVRGKAEAIDVSGKSRSLKEKSEIFVEDTIKTSSKGRVRMEFLDNTIISLGVSGELKVAEYQWDAIKRTGAMKSEIRDGAFRVLGGLITKHSPENFTTHTPSASIGIRGSMYAGLAGPGELSALYLGGTGIDVGNSFGEVSITQPGFGTRVTTGMAPMTPFMFTAQDITPILEGLGDVGGSSMIQEITGSEGTTMVEDEEDCYGPDCEWYQKLLNTIEEAEDKAYAARSCMESSLELEKIHLESLMAMNKQTMEQMNRTVTAWQTAKVLRAFAKGFWEAAKFLSGDPTTAVNIAEDLAGALMGSDETRSGAARMGGMAAGSPEAFKQEAIAQAKSELKQQLEDAGYSSSVSQGVADGVVTGMANIYESRQKGAPSGKMLAADVAAQAINGYVQGLNEERKQRIKDLERDMNAESAVIAAANERIFNLRQSITETNTLIAGIRTEKEKLLAMARECKLKRRRACWEAYDKAVKSANDRYARTIKGLDDAENAKDAQRKSTAEEAEALRQKLIKTYEEIRELEKQNEDTLEDYRRTKSDLEIAEEAKVKAQEEASKFARESGTVGYSKPFQDLLTDLHNEIQELKAKLKPLEQKAKPINRELEKMRKQADKDYAKLKNLEEKEAKLDEELDALREKNKAKRENALAKRDKNNASAKAKLDACLDKVWSETQSKDKLQYTMARHKGASDCDAMKNDAKAAYEAVRKNNQPRQVKVPCPKKKGMVTQPPVSPPPEGQISGTGLSYTCPAPLNYGGVSIGPKSEIGGGVAKVADDMAKKAISKGLGSLFGGGGGGISFGGGGAAPTGGSSGPKLHKNPIRNMQPFNFPEQGVKLKVGGKFTDDGKLLIATEIDKAPGKGTFHEVRLHDFSCRTMWPVYYYAYSLWAEWSLSVKYTYITEHYVDGKLVSRTVEETDWTEIDSGRTLLDSGSFTILGKPVKFPGIWSLYGFDRATGGLDEVGSVFNVSRNDLMNPVAVTISVTSPNDDPVKAIPFNFFICPNGKELTFIPIDEFMSNLANDGYQYPEDYDGQGGYRVNPAFLKEKVMGGGMTQIDPPALDLSAGDDEPVDSVADDLQPPGSSSGDRKDPALPDEFGDACPSWENISPRISLTYDIGSDGKTIARPAAEPGRQPGAQKDAADIFTDHFIYSFGSRIQF